MAFNEMEVEELARFIKECETSQKILAKSVKSKLAYAKLKMGCWVCKKQGISPSLENLAASLGPDFKDTVQHIPNVKKELGDEGPKI